MAISFIGLADWGTPTDGGFQAGPTYSITPNATTNGQNTGDLIILVAQYRGAVTFSLTSTGGQSWTSENQISTTNVTGRVFWCIFNGTWSSALTLSNSAGTNALSARMLTFRSSSSRHVFGIDQAQAELDFVAPSTPFTVTITGQVTTKPSTLTVVGWMTADDNTWDTLTGGWNVAGNNQVRNTEGQDQSFAIAYKIQSAEGATGNVSKNQATNGGDAGTSFIITFFENKLPNPVIINQAVNRSNTY